MREGQRRLAANDITGPGLDARLLFGFAAGMSHEQIIAAGRDPVSSDLVEKYHKLIARRADGEPAAQLIGVKEFWGLTFQVNRDVLSPRPDSESLIELAMEMLAAARPRTILDIGTGTGCLMAALLHEFPEAQGTALDISEAALEVARQNIFRLGFSVRCAFQQGDFRQNIIGPYDLVISNPPYIRLAERAALPVEVREFEPAGALFAGEDGLDAYRAICAQLPNLLTPGTGTAILELGQGQGASVTGLLDSAFQGRPHKLTQRRDLSGIVRALGLTLR